MRYSSNVTRRHRRGRTEYVAVLNFYDHGGKRRQKRRTANSHSEAKRIARELEDEYIEGGEVALYSDDLTFEDLQSLTGTFSHNELQLFAIAYRQRRKDPHTVLLTAIIGLVAIPGLQRFWLGQVGLGFVHLFTWGLLLIGSILDLIRYKLLR